MHTQVANGYEECVEILLNSRADPTLRLVCMIYLSLLSPSLSVHPSSPYRDHQGRTAVHFAASCGHVAMVEYLLQSGGSPSLPDKHGYTPIHWSAYNGHEKCLEVLLDVRHSSSFVHTIMLCMFFNGCSESIKQSKTLECIPSPTVVVISELHPSMCAIIVTCMLVANNHIPP